MAIGLLGRVRVWRGPAYFVAGFALWVAMVESGVHPTIAGVLLGLLAPCIRRGAARSSGRRCSPARSARTRRPRRRRSAMLGVGAAISPNERLQELLHPWTSYVVVPLFALANAGVPLGGDAISRAVSSPITIGIVVGLVAGKTIGISLASFLAVRLGLGTLPRGVTMRHVVGAAALAGIGFTVSLFVTDLAFDDEVLRDEAKVGVLARVGARGRARLAAVPAGGLRRRADTGAPVRLDPPVDRAHDHIRGPLDAPLSLVEYGDCGVPVLRRGDRGRRRAAQALRRPAAVRLPPPAARGPPPPRPPGRRGDGGGRRAQGRFWEMHDRLFAEQDRLKLDDLVGHAQALGMDAERFLEALRDDVHEAAIDADIDSAERSGVTGTPTFFVNGERVKGTSRRGGARGGPR